MRNLLNVKQDCQSSKGLAVLTCLFVLSFNVYADEIALTAEQIKQLGIEIGQLKPAAAIPVLNAPAKVIIPPQHEAIVSAPQAGLVQKLNVSVGDAVKKGQPLAVLNSPDLVDLQHRYLQAALEKSLAFNNLQRDKQLFDAGVIAQRRLLETKSDYQSKDAELANSAQLLKIAGMSDSAIQNLAQTRKFNSQTTLAAPINGTVLERLATAGERVNALAPLYKVADLSQLWLEIAVPQEKISSVKIGDEVAISHSAATAKITLLGKSVNAENQAVIARAVITTHPETLRAGQSVTIQLIQANHSLGFEVPNTALAQNAGKSYLFVRNAKGFSVVPVNVIGKQGTDSIISGALKGTEQIALKGAGSALKANWLGLGSEEE